MDLRSEVERFKEWAATQPQSYGEWEVDYGEWSSLYAAAEGTLSKPEIDDAEVSLLLYALARDNESEIIRDMLEEHPFNGLRLARAAQGHPDPDARWQVADFLGTQRDPGARELHRRFVSDEHEYVRRRAFLALTANDPGFAELTARGWIGSADDYCRLAALSVLHDLRSPHLKEALDRLRDDPLVYVRAKVADIEDER